MLQFKNYLSPYSLHLQKLIKDTRKYYLRRNERYNRRSLAEKIKNISIEIYNFGAKKLEQSGIILADTKFEFGLDENNELMIIDEILTPDSSRFWLKENYLPGHEQTNFDKQVLRDYLESINWDKKPPAPTLPKEIIQKTLDKYKEAYNRIVSA